MWDNLPFNEFLNKGSQLMERVVNKLKQITDPRFKTDLREIARLVCQGNDLTYEAFSDPAHPAAFLITSPPDDRFLLSTYIRRSREEYLSVIPLWRDSSVVWLTNTFSNATSALAVQDVIEGYLYRDVFSRDEKIALLNQPRLSLPAPPKALPPPPLALPLLPGDSLN